MFVNLGLKDQAFTQGIGRAKTQAMGLKTALKEAMVQGVAQGATMVGFNGIAEAIKGVAGTGLQMNSVLEQNQVSFQVLTRDADKAAKIIKNLYSYAATTPFEFPDIAAAARTLQTVGLEGDKVIKWVGDLAAANPQATIGEVASAVAKLKSGSFGEAFERLRDFGISKMMLEGAGLKFDKSGSYQGSVDQAMTAVQKIVADKYGGMAAAQSQTFAGMVSTIKDTLNMTMGTAFEGIFNDLKAKMPAIIEKLGSIGDAFKKGGLQAALKEVIPPDLVTRAAGVFGKMKELVSSFWSAFTDGAAGSGGSALDVVRKFMDALNAYLPTLVPLAQDLGGALGTALSTITTTMAEAGQGSDTAGNKVKGALGAFLAMKAAGPAVTGLGVAVKGVGVGVSAVKGVGTALTAAKQGATDFYAGLTNAKAAASAFSGPMGTLGGKVSAAAGGLKTLATNALSMATNMAKGTVAIIRQGAAWVATTAKAAAAKVAMLAQAAVQGVVKAATVAWTGVQWALNAAMSANPIGLIVAAIVALVAAVLWAWNNVDWFRNGVLGAWSAISQGLLTAWNAVKGAAMAVWNWLVGFFKQWGVYVLAALLGPMAMLVAFMVKNWDTIKASAMAVWNGIKAGLSAIWNGIVAAAKFVWGALKAAIVAYFTVYRIIIMAVWNALKTGTLAVWRGISSAVSGVWNALRSTASNAFNAISRVVLAVWGSLKSGTVAAWNGLKTTVTNLWVGLVNALKAKVSLFVSIGKAISDGIKQGISNAWNALVTKLKGLVNLLPAAVKKLLGIKSPSRVFAGLGKEIPAGLGMGVISNMKPALAAVSSLAARTVAAFSGGAGGVSLGMTPALSGVGMASSSSSLVIHPGAIVVQGAGDPDAVADRIMRKLHRLGVG